MRNDVSVAWAWGVARPDRRAPRRKRGAAFTLVELLVVVAIIAVLASILAPSLSRGLERARQAFCLSNLHQLGLAGHAYKAAHHQYPPEQPGIMGVTGDVEAWPRMFKPYAQSTDAFTCPAAPEWMKWDGKPFQTRYGATPFSYGLLVWGTADSAYLGWWTPAGSATPGRRETEIVRPGDFYWLSDSNGGLPEDPVGMWDLVTEVHLNDWCTPLENPGDRHLGGTNMLYADGQAVWIDRDEMYLAGRAPAGSPAKRMWRRKQNIDNQPHEEHAN